MGYGYRRESNILGWLAFFGIGAAVFAGLVFALIYFKKQVEIQDKKALAKLPQTNHPTLGRAPEEMVKDELKKMYAKDGKGLDPPKFGEPKEVVSEISKRKVVIIQVQHREAGSDRDYTDEVFVLDRTKITRCKTEEWPRIKAGLGIAEDP